MSIPKQEFLPDMLVCPDFWVNREGWFLFGDRIVCLDFDCYCDVCADYRAELLD